MGIEILSEIVLYQKGSLKRVRRYLRDMHPHLGIITRGFTGWETIQEIDVVVPIAKFSVIDLTPSIVSFSELEIKKDLAST